MTQAEALIDRFRGDLDRLAPPGPTVGIAVSGGADSLALLLLAAAVRPGRIEAATVDHGLRTAGAQEADMVAAICATIGVPHRRLTLVWAEQPKSNIQAEARQGRYTLLGQWARERGIGAVATAHHADDQAETLLMRLARGAGVSGLGGIRPTTFFDGGLTVVRPLLNWRRAELRDVVDEAGLVPVDDPGNRDPRFDRSAARALLSSARWLDPVRLAAAASHVRDAGEALDWAAAKEFAARSVVEDDGSVRLSASGLPHELRRRLLVAAMHSLGAREPTGPDLMKALDRLDAGEVTTLAGLKLEGGDEWRLSLAPSRRG